MSEDYKTLLLLSESRKELRRKRLLREEDGISIRQSSPGVTETYIPTDENVLQATLAHLEQGGNLEDLDLADALAQSAEVLPTKEDEDVTRLLDDLLGNQGVT